MVVDVVLVAADTTVGIDYQLPAWLAVILGFVTLLGTVLGTLQLVARTIAPIHTEIRAWMRTTDLVTEHAPQWDQGLAELAKAVEGLAAVTRTLGNVQGDIAVIREQVTIDHGDSLKDRIMQLGERGDERHNRLDRRLDNLEHHLRRQDAAHGASSGGLEDHLDRQDVTQEAMHPREPGGDAGP